MIVYSLRNAAALAAITSPSYWDTPDELMIKSDKIAMSAGLEGRFPFLDHRLVEFGLSLPEVTPIFWTVVK